jgi:hypothetical protein
VTHPNDQTNDQCECFPGGWVGSEWQEPDNRNCPIHWHCPQLLNGGFEENDPETATPYTHPPTLTIERTEWVDEEGAHVLAVEGEPTTPTMFIPLDREARP